MRVAVIGTGISGMSAAWLLSRSCDVVVYEQATRLGGHSNTIEVPGAGPVDMGFIVYNEATYPNLAALFRHLDVPTRESDMSFAVSRGGGALEYAGTDLSGLFAQRRNLVNPRFWAMLRDLVRFYRQARRDAETGLADYRSLGEYLATNRYGEAFLQDHLLPMAAAIWSTPAERMAEYPAAAFLRFCRNHGLLQLTGRPAWRTVVGGSREYVRRLTAPYADRIRLGCGVRSILREPGAVLVRGTDRSETAYDHVVIAAHADQALAMLDDPMALERHLLGALSYRPNDAILHRDPALMPHRRKVWSSWNYIAGQGGGDARPFVSYWMNRLQPLHAASPVFVTLNAPQQARSGTVFHRESYAHPQFDIAALSAQRRLWSIQGVRRTWYCGAYFGAGFHEDGLQAGLAVAEALGGVRRPWTVPDESGRIFPGQGAGRVTA